ncbi:MAG TPA: PEP/pyruvate-binding domain-containing protein, partial [bacterium]|nr:PEP/pyruvate-binding domain-containing protein [bacterium]
MSRFLLHDNDTAPLHAIGGKAAGLRRLQSLGLRVPHFVILSADAYRIACADGAVPDSLPPDIARAVHTAWEELGGGTVPLAVRSSAVEEDGMTRSFAGQMETALNVQTLDALMTAVLGCWRSLHSQRACAYRSWAGTQEAPAMSVVIQAMIVPEVSGVAFTMNPVSGRRDEILVNAIWGLGEGLVSGALDADTFVLDREGRVTSRHLASKETQIV